MRAQIQAMLERAATAAGLPPNRFRSHSLRIGGATALYHVFPDAEIIKRWGRWQSTAFQAYLWESSEAAKGVAEKMAADRSTLHVSESATPRTGRPRARRVRWADGAPEGGQTSR